MPTRTYTTNEVCDIADVSYRRLDYWVRCGLVEPAAASAKGSGSRRSWMPRQVATVAVLGAVVVANRYGQMDHLRQLVGFLEDLPLRSWDGTRIVLDETGDVWRFDAGGVPQVGIYIDLSVAGPVVARLAVLGGVA